MIRLTVTETMEFDPPREHPGRGAPVAAVAARATVALELTDDGDPRIGWRRDDLGDGISVDWEIQTQRTRKNGTLSNHSADWRTVYRHAYPPALDPETRRIMLDAIVGYAEHIANDKWARHIYDRISREVAP